MPKTKVTEKMKKEIKRKVKHEFPGCKSLQDLHYYRYIKDIEWRTMSNEEIIKDIKEGADEVKKEIEIIRQREKVNQDVRQNN
jgi:hypothetical protein